MTRQRKDVLLVMAREGSRLGFEQSLDDADISGNAVPTCAEVELALKNLGIPATLFSGAPLPDGTWADVPDLCNREMLQLPLNYGFSTDVANLDIIAIQEGASGFILPVFFQQNIFPVLEYAKQKGAAVQRLAAA